jgi:excisionase family DNA binding protein
MPYTVAEAAETIGKSKAAIFRAIRKGKLSATRDTSRGVFLIDLAELHRAFPPAPTVSADTLPDTVVDTSRFAELHGRLADAHDQIADLRRRLDQREADHRQALDRLAAAQERITALLTDQRAPPPAAPVVPGPAPRRRWLPWRRG